MTRKTDSGGTTATANRATASLRHLRVQIDKLDLQILKLVNERAAVAAEIGKVKNDHGSDVFSPAREEEVLQNVLQANKGPLDTSTVRAIFREIMSGSRALQKVVKVSYLGPEDSFSHLAAVERFGRTVEFMQVGSIAAVFEEVNRSHADFGVVPLENSTDGRVADTLDMFMRLPQLKIVSEVRLPIHHNLLSNCEQQKIGRVYSKEQALSQCRTWLSETRFAVIGPEEKPKSGHDKTAVMFKIPHRPGSLVDALNIFKQNKLNLTWIESFPAKGPGSEYVFFVDFEGHQDDPKVKRALANLREHCEQLSILGSYPMASPST